MIDIDSLPLEQLVAGAVGVLVVMVATILWLKQAQSKGEAEAEKERERQRIAREEAESTVEEIIPTTQGGNGKNKGRKNDRWRDTKKEGATYSHPWYITTLKGHTSTVCDFDFAPDGKRCVSIGEDSSLILWNVRDFAERDHKAVHGQLEFDSASHVSFAPDSKSLLLSMKRENKLAVYKLVKREDTGNYKFVHADNVDFPQMHTLDIAHMGIASNGRFVFSATPDAKAVLYSIKGDVLGRVEPSLGSLFNATVSPDARFITMCGFCPDSFVYEVSFTRTGEFTSAKKAFSLKGADSGIYATAFNQDSSRAVTLSRDGYWRVFNTDIRHAQGEDAKVLQKGEWTQLKGANPEQIHLSVSPTGGSFAVAIGKMVKFFCAEDASMDFEELSEVHPTHITRVRVSVCGRMVATSGDKYLRVFHNVPEYHAEIVRLTRSLPNATNDGSKRRIQEQIDECRAAIEKLISV